MLGKQHAHAAFLRNAAGQLHQRHALARGHASGGLVHQQQLRVVGQRHGQFHPFDVAIGQIAAGAVGLGLHIDLGQQSQRIGPAVAGSAGPPVKDFAIGRQQRHLHVFNHGQRGKGLRNLKCAAHAQSPDGTRRQAGDGFAVEQYLAAVGLQLSAHHVEAGGLARAIGADQGQQFTRLKAERDVLHRFHAAKGFADVFHLQQAHDAAPSLFLGAIRAHSNCA